MVGLWEQLNKLRAEGCSHPTVGRRYVAGSPAASGIITEGIRCLDCGEVLDSWCATNPAISLEDIEQRCQAFGERYCK